jgi:hypothetical protein
VSKPLWIAAPPLYLRRSSASPILPPNFFCGYAADFTGMRKGGTAATLFLVPPGKAQLFRK